MVETMRADSKTYFRSKDTLQTLMAKHNFVTLCTQNI